MNLKRRAILCVVASLALVPYQAWARPSAANSTPGKFFALSLGGNTSGLQTLNRDGVPFTDGVLLLKQGGSAQVPVGAQAQRIFFLGMTDAQSATRAARTHSGPGPRRASPYGWADPRDYHYRFFVGDELGQIRLQYADGSTQVFPLRFGEGVWFGDAFYQFQQPFPTDARLRQAFSAALRLYPQTPVEDGSYVGVIVPRPIPIRSISVENSPAKRGTLIIEGITVESANAHGIAGATTLQPSAFSPEFRNFIRTKALLPVGEDEKQANRRLDNLRQALYTTNKDFKHPVAPSVPPGYQGPEVSFKGDIFSGILANVFRYNLNDIADKIDPDGMYHTSTKGAVSWGGYNGFGTFRYGVGAYYGVSYTRDMGRSLQELAALGDTRKATSCADYSLRVARLWIGNPALKYKGVSLPPHWGDLANHPRNPSFENDGQGLMILAFYRLWQRLPDRSAWLRGHWPDIKDAGDWILWQFAHPEVSGARDGVLHSSGESANGFGYSVYPDAVSMTALQALAQMADSIGETGSASQWRARAALMQQGITRNYIVDDPKYGRVWSLKDSNWTHKSTVLGPLIFQADLLGLAPEDSIPEWRAVNAATYQRLIDTYKPFGFYGQSMGYGQGFVTQSALLLDRMHDATQMLDWTAKEIYDPRIGSYIVPEGVQIDPTGRYWFHMGDLGNGVQEAEIVKTLAVVIGVDDTHPDRLQFFPRMPFDWKQISIGKYPLAFESHRALQTASLSYDLRRAHHGMDLTISADKDLGPVAMRLGPFAAQPNASDIRVNGKTPTGSSIEHSGDSWWIRFTAPVGTDK